MNSLAKYLIAVVATILASSGIAQPPDLERYIVVLTQGSGASDQVAADVAIRANGQVGYIYEHAMQGFSIMVPRAALKGIEQDPRVAYVEKDTPVSILAQAVPTGIDRTFASGNTNLDIDSTDDFRVDADVAVLDTGIDLEHSDLNVVGGANCLQTSGGGPPWARTYYCDPAVSADDDHYHGTHVAGTIGALDNGFGVVGIAPGVRLWAVKVLDSQGSGYTSGIIAGIDWVVEQGSIEVLNMSLGGSGVNTAYETAIDNAVASGVIVVVAAGNSDVDANNYSPAFVPSAITVSALADFNGQPGGGAAPTCRTDQDDTLADFSNWGSAVDIAAPGVCISSTFPIERGEYGTISGTSMAAPHVAGAAAILASGANSPTNTADVLAIRDALVYGGNSNWTDDSGDGTKESLLDTSDDVTFSPTLVAGGGESGGGGGTNTPPRASFTVNCTDLSCDFDASGSSNNGDGTITAYDWDFGDGNMGSGVTPLTHMYDEEGIYAATLTVIEDDGSSDTDSQNVTVSSGGGGGGTLLSSSTNNGSSWTANVWLEDTNATLNGSWTYSGGAASCSGNECSLTGIRKRESSVTFTSDLGESVTILKP